jgi:hypothetical protein
MLHDPWKSRQGMKPAAFRGITTPRALAKAAASGIRRMSPCAKVSGQKVGVRAVRAETLTLTYQRERALARKAKLDRTEVVQRFGNTVTRSVKRTDGTGEKFQALQPVSTDSIRVL